MTKTRREFSPEFKREAVALLDSGGRPLLQVATELGVSPSMLRNWRRVVRGEPTRSQVAPSSVSAMPSLGDQNSEITRLKRELDRTRMERDVLKKAIGIFEGAQMSFRFIRDHADRWLIRLMCRVLDVSASGYYAWRNRPDSSRVVANRALLADVRRLHGENHGRYGSPPGCMPRCGRRAGRPAGDASRG